MIGDALTGLNDDQRRAVSFRNGPLLIVAGPGSGKTRVITHRIAYRAATGQVPSDRVLAITFTNRAAREMEMRVRALVGDAPAPHVGTYHWACNAILRRYGSSRTSRNFRLLTPAEARTLVREAAVGLPVSERGRLPAAISATKNGMSVPAAARRHAIDEKVLEAVRAAYDGRLQSLAALDLDDLILKTVVLLSSDASVRERCRSRYHEVLIDEFQDSNPVQQSLVELLAPLSRNVVAVGDPDQAIYGWRQADSGTAGRFLSVFPDAEVVTLSRSYRSTKRILRAASSLIAHNPARIGGDLFTDNTAGGRPVCYVAHDETDEAEWVSREIRELTSVSTGTSSIGVLYRVNAQSRAIEDALLRHGIGYQVVGARRFVERPAVRRATALLRLAAGDDDEAVAYLSLGVRGIGDRRLTRARERAEREHVSLLDSLSSPPPGTPREAAGRLNGLASAVKSLREIRAFPLLSIVDAAVNYLAEEMVTSSGVDVESGMEDLAELRSLVVEMGPRATLPGLLDRVTIGNETQSTRRVSLMTLHAAKGLEFSTVFIVGLEEGLLPHRRSLDRSEDIEEERRLCYVGMTRAMHRLYLSYARSRLLGGHSSSGEASRFIGEIGQSHISTRVSPERPEKPRLTSACIGDAVTHPRWRRGVVKAVEGTGRDTLVTVEFDTGTRRLQLCHAPLRRLGGTSTDVPSP